MVTNDDAPADAFTLSDVAGVAVVVEKAVGTKCARSWKILPTVGEDAEYPDVSPRDAQALREWKALGVSCLNLSVPAKAGTHNHRRSRNKQRTMTSLFKQRPRHGAMGPGVRRDDGAFWGDGLANDPAPPRRRHRRRSSRWSLDQASKLWLLFVFDIAHRGAVQGHAVLRPGAGLEHRDQLRLVPERQPGGPDRPDGDQGGGGDRAGDLDGALAHLLATIALGLIIGGAIGNAIDRFAYGAVVDFALFHVEIGGKTYNWYVFNLADVAIVAGVAALLYDSFLGVPAAKAP